MPLRCAASPPLPVDTKPRFAGHEIGLRPNTKVSGAASVGPLSSFRAPVPHRNRAEARPTRCGSPHLGVSSLGGCGVPPRLVVTQTLPGKPAFVVARSAIPFVTFVQTAQRSFRVPPERRAFVSGDGWVCPAGMGRAHCGRRGTCSPCRRHGRAPSRRRRPPSIAGFRGCA